MNRKIILLILAAVLMRALFYELYSPLFGMDSLTYVETARALFGGDLSHYSGKRPILYPLIMYLFNYDIQALVIFQMLLGVIQSLLIYRIFLKLTQSEWIGFTSGMLYAINPSQIYLERAILGETVLTVFVAVTYLIFIKAVEKKRNYLPCLFIGLLSSAAILTKPQVIFLSPLLGFLLSYYYFTRIERKIIPASYRFIATMIPAVLLLGSWSYFNCRATGYFAVSTMAGDALILHTHPFIEKAPARYGELKEIYIKHRELKFKKTGIYSPMTLLPAKVEAMEKLNLNYPDLSRLLMEVSIYLIIHNPGKYLKSVFFSFKRFWYPSWYSDKGGISRSIRSGETGRALPAAIFALAYIFAILIFFLFPVLLTIYPSLRKSCRLDYRILPIYVITLTAGIFQAFTINSTETARYKMPFEPFIFGVAVIFSVCLWNYFRNKARKADST